MRNKLFLIVGFMLTTAFSQKLNEKRISKLEKIGYAIDSTLFNSDYKYVDDIYNIKGLTERFFIESEDSEIKKYNSGFYKGFSGNFSLGKELVKQIELGAEYTFLRAYSENDEYFLLFRLFGEEGLNYHRHLIKYINNEPKIVDTYIYLTGEYLSESFKVIYEMSLNNLSFMKRILNRNDLKDYEKIDKMKRYRDSGKYEELVELYESLNEKSKKKKIFKIYSLLGSQHLSEELYIKYIDEYEKEFPNDPSLYLISMDGFIMKNQFDDALTTLDKLDKSIGIDDFLDYYRGNIYYMKKDYKMSKDKFLNVVSNYPNFVDGYDGLLTLYIESNEKGKAIEILNVMVERFDLRKEDLKSSVEETFQDFSKSNEFKAWLNK
ncbi:tetratricopeptide repeat protein [Tenacibaculum sp. MEBiC06402]|uniref:tetratricopeptide repeat protein n=1 Tax=unclassified Tenacibaculum TaxID=2635139 RepID=UPI003B9AAC94